MKEYTEEYYRSFPDQLLSKKLLSFEHYQKNQWDEGQITKFLLDNLYQQLAPSYFQGSSNDNEATTVFMASGEGQLAKSQLLSCLNYIKNWADQQQLEITSEQKVSEVLNGFIERLNSDFFSNKQNLFYSDGKKNIESITFFIQDSAIDLSFRQNVILKLSLDNGLEMCADGCFSRFQMANEDLKNYNQFNLETLARQFSSSLAKQTAISEGLNARLCNAVHISIRGNEIHAYNALFHHLFNELQLNELIPQDSFISIFRNVNPTIYKDYTQLFKENFNGYDFTKFILDSFYAKHNIRFYNGENEPSFSLPIENDNFQEILSSFLNVLGEDESFGLPEILAYEEGGLCLKNEWIMQITVFERLLEKGWFDLSPQSRLFNRYSLLNQYLSVQKELVYEALDHRIVPNHLKFCWIKDDENRIHLLDYLDEKGLSSLQTKFPSHSVIITNIEDLLTFLQIIPAQDAVSLTAEHINALDWLSADYDYFDLFFIKGNEQLLTYTSGTEVIAELDIQKLSEKLNILLNFLDEQARIRFTQNFYKKQPFLHYISDLEELTQRFVRTIPIILFDKGVKSFNKIFLYDATINNAIDHCNFNEGKLAKLIFKTGIVDSSFLNINNELGFFEKIIVEGVFARNIIKESFINLNVENMNNCYIQDSFGLPEITVIGKTLQSRFSNFQGFLKFGEIYETNLDKVEGKIHVKNIFTSSFSECAIHLKTETVIDTIFKNLKPSTLYIRHFIRGGKFEKCDDLILASKDLVDVTFIEGKPKKLHFGLRNLNTDRHLHQMNNMVQDCIFSDLILFEKENAHLSNLFFEKNTVIRNTYFKNMDFQGAFLSGFFSFDESYQQTGKLYFENSKFSSKSLSRFLTHTSVSQFKNSNLKFFFLEGTDLSQIDFQIADFKSILLNFQISFKKTQLMNANFKDYPFTSQWDFTEANLQHAEFGTQDLTGIKFINADLTGCDLSQTLTTHADFTDAKIDSIKLNTQQLFQFYQQGHRDFSSLQLTPIENFEFTDRHLQGCKLSAQAFDSLIQQRYKNFQAVDLSEVAHDVLEQYIHLDAYNFVAVELPTLLSHCSSPKQSRLEREKRAIKDTCLFDESDLDEIKNELEEIDATKLKRLLETEPVEKGQQIIDYLTEKSLPIKGENNPKIQKIYDNLYLLNGAQQFFNKLNFGLIGMDAVAGIITGDVNKTFISLGMLGGNEVLGRISRFAAANQQAAWGRALSKFEPLSGQILTFVVLYNIIGESAAYKKGNKEILGNLIGDSLFVNFNLNSAAANFMANRWMVRALSMQTQFRPVIPETLGELAAEDLEVNVAGGMENVNLAGETLEGAEALGLEENAAADVAEGIVATGIEETAVGVEGASSAAGFLGAAAIAGVLAEITAGLGFTAFVGTRIYSATMKVKHINDHLPLTGNEKLCEGINALLGFNLFGQEDAEIRAELEFQKKLELQLKKYTTKLIDIPEISHIFIPFIGKGAINYRHYLMNRHPNEYISSFRDYFGQDINCEGTVYYSSLDFHSMNRKEYLWRLGVSFSSEDLNYGYYGPECVFEDDYYRQIGISLNNLRELRYSLMGAYCYFDATQREVIDETLPCTYDFENNVILLDKFYHSGLTWDRDRPNDVQDELVCFPKSTQSTAIPGHGYLCEGAFGARLNNNEYAHALIILNSGNDTAQGFPNSSNTFTFNEGHKRLDGGSKADIFIAKGNVISGHIDGDDGINTLHLEQFFLKDKILEIDLLKNYLTHTDYQQKIFNIFNIQKLITRKGRTERITVNCYTQYINGQAGKKTSRDFIDIPDLDCQPPMKLKIIMAADTYVKNQAHRGYFSYLFHRDKGESVIDIIGQAQNITHEFLFNYRLSEVDEIKFQSAAENSTKLTIHFFNQHFYNISLTIPDQQTTVLQLNDKTEIHIRKNMTMTLHHSHLSSITETITRFIPKTKALQGLFIIQNPMNETITLGHPDYLNLLANNPHFCNHLLGNGIENIYRITANLEAPLETISHSVCQIAPNVTLYPLKKNQTRDSLDLISLHKQLKKQLNCTSQLAIQQIQTDLALQIDCTSNEMLHQMHILLKGALDWYQKIEIYQELYPLVIVKNPEVTSRWKLVPKPIVISENKTQIVLLANRVQPYSSFILAKKAMSNLKFLYENRDNSNNLLITNYSPELTEDQLFFISIKKFFQNPIWKTITLQGNDFTIHLSEVSSVNITGTLADLKPSLNFLTANHIVQHQERIDVVPAAQERSFQSAVIDEPNYLTSSATKPVTWLNSIFSYSKGLLSTLTDIVKPRVSDSLKANLSALGDAPSCFDIFNNDITPASSDANGYSQTKNLSTVHSFPFFQTNATKIVPDLLINLLFGQIFLNEFCKRGKPRKALNYDPATYNPTSFFNHQYLNDCESIVKNSIANCEQKFG